MERIISARLQAEEEERRLQEDIEMIIGALAERRLSTTESNLLQVHLPDENEDSEEIKVSEVTTTPSAPLVSSDAQTENCVICFEPRNGIFAFDCGHAVTCVKCATKLVRDSKSQRGSQASKCPVCRKQVTKMIKVFT